MVEPAFRPEPVRGITVVSPAGATAAVGSTYRPTRPNWKRVEMISSSDTVLIWRAEAQLFPDLEGKRLCAVRVSEGTDCWQEVQTNLAGTGGQRTCISSRASV